MIKQLMYKIFKLEPDTCQVCEVLREQLYRSDAERKELLTRVLAPSVPPVIDTVKEEELTPIKGQFVPWRIRQQMLEQEEDKVKARLMKDKVKEIADLEKELGIVPLMETK